MKSLALFDFDGTLYKKDSLLEVTKFIAGRKKFWTGMALLSPYLVALKLGLLHNAKVKTKYLTHFFKGMDHDAFKTAAGTFALQQIDKNLNPVLKAALANHLANGDDVYIVTASFTEWLLPWCELNNVKLISSKLEIKSGSITGKITDLNCYGPEKIVQIRKAINLDNYDAIEVYGNGKGDAEMLMLKRLK